MKKILFAALLAVTFTASAQQAAQQPAQVTNRYSMKLKQNTDGSYSLINEARYAKLVDLSKVEGLLEPYTYQRDRLQSKDYKGVEVREYVYRTHDGYELKMAVDMAVSEQPTPVVIYCHGGGWARGNNGALRTLSQYMAKQKGVTGVRIAYTLAPQPGATVEVSIDDVLAAVKYLRDHAKELNIDPSRIGFVGNSAGAHLAAVGAMRTQGAKAFVGYSGDGRHLPAFEGSAAHRLLLRPRPEGAARRLTREPRTEEERSGSAALLRHGRHHGRVRTEQGLRRSPREARRKGRPRGARELRPQPERQGLGQDGGGLLQDGGFPG